MKRLMWPILVVVFLTLSAVAQNWMDARRRAPQPVEETLYVSSGDALKRASLGFDGLTADIYWIRTLLYFGEKFEQQRGANQYFEDYFRWSRRLYLALAAGGAIYLLLTLTPLASHLPLVSPSGGG